MTEGRFGGSCQESNRRLALQFESLGGGGHGCEFGLFQRQLGAEPLGLLRWADLGYEQLARALETRFAGVGDPAFTIVFAPPAGHNDEWWTRDIRHHMAMRTFVKVADVPYESMVKAACKRLQFLRTKLISDLQSGDKIFVFRHLYRNLKDDEVLHLKAAVGGYGKNVLLYIRYEDSDHPNGTVAWRDEGLMIGYIDHFEFSPDEKYVGSATESLSLICRRAIELRDGKFF